MDNKKPPRFKFSKRGTPMRLIDGPETPETRQYVKDVKAGVSKLPPSAAKAVRKKIGEKS